MDYLWLVLCVNRKIYELRSFVAFSLSDAKHLKNDFLSCAHDSSDWRVMILRSVLE